MSTTALAPVAFAPVRSAQPVGAPSRTAQPRLRITRRGRMVLGALLATPLAVALAVSALSSAPAQAGSTASTASFEYISVATGESLWELAEWIAPEADPREVIADIVALNQLPSADVHPGQRLAIPAEYAG